VVVVVVVVVDATKREHDHVQHMDVDKARATSRFISWGKLTRGLQRLGRQLLYTCAISARYLVAPRIEFRRPALAGRLPGEERGGDQGFAGVRAGWAGLVLGHLLLHVIVNSLFLRDTGRMYKVLHKRVVYLKL
jgi:hypothetical protein